VVYVSGISLCDTLLWHVLWCVRFATIAYLLRSSWLSGGLAFTLEDVSIGQRSVWMRDKHTISAVVSECADEGVTFGKEDSLCLGLGPIASGRRRGASGPMPLASWLIVGSGLSASSQAESTATLSNIWSKETPYLHLPLTRSLPVSGLVDRRRYRCFLLIFLAAGLPSRFNRPFTSIVSCSSQSAHLPSTASV
jgi:hypothetical protein